MKLIGYVDGIEVKFDFYPPNQFKAEIPRKLNGTYIVEFKVIDDAGNETNYSNVFIKINFSKMSFEILKSYEEKEEIKNYDFNELSDVFSELKLDETISFRELEQKYSYRELVI